MTVEFEISPSEYWDMTPIEVGRNLERRRPKQIGGMHEDEFHRLIARREEKIKQGVNVL